MVKNLEILNGTDYTAEVTLIKEPGTGPLYEVRVTRPAYDDPDVEEVIGHRTMSTSGWRSLENIVQAIIDSDYVSLVGTYTGTNEEEKDAE